MVLSSGRPDARKPDTAQPPAGVASVVRQSCREGATEPRLEARRRIYGGITADRRSMRWDTAIAIQQNLMRRSHIRTKLNIYDDLVKDEMAQAQFRAVGSGSRRMVANRQGQ